MVEENYWYFPVTNLNLTISSMTQVSELTSRDLSVFISIKGMI